MSSTQCHPAHPRGCRHRPAADSLPCAPPACFPSMALQMTAIGEESGALDAMLDKVATYYEAEVDNAVDGLTS
jgi:hypothetical protein